jgi:hypothetical protein
LAVGCAPVTLLAVLAGSHSGSGFSGSGSVGGSTLRTVSASGCERLASAAELADSLALSVDAASELDTLRVAESLVAGWSRSCVDDSAGSSSCDCDRPLASFVGESSGVEVGESEGEGSDESSLA